MILNQFYPSVTIYKAFAFNTKYFDWECKYSGKFKDNNLLMDELRGYESFNYYNFEQIITHILDVTLKVGTKKFTNNSLVSKILMYENKLKFIIC